MNNIDDFVPFKTPETWVASAAHTELSIRKNLGMVCVKDGYAYGCDGIRFHRCRTSISKNGMFSRKDLTPVISISSDGKQHLSCGDYPTEKIDSWLSVLMDISSVEISKCDLKQNTLDNGQVYVSTGDVFDRPIAYDANFIDEAFNGCKTALVNKFDLGYGIVLVGRHEFGYFGIMELKVDS